jgi:hypothetical protein
MDNQKDIFGDPIPQVDALGKQQTAGKYQR